jgi:hypothetical protein
MAEAIAGMICSSFWEGEVRQVPVYGLIDIFTYNCSKFQ